MSDILHSVQKGDLELFFGIDKTTFEDSYFIGIGNNVSGEAHSIELSREDLLLLKNKLNQILPHINE